MGMQLKHIISTKQFDIPLIDSIFDIADNMPHSNKSMDNRIMASLFYEPSTRTRFSFETAMLRLGGQVITSDNMKESSSVSKGETLEDTIKVLNSYVDIIVLRHNEEGAAERASKVSSVPIINAGDGSGEHPSQALLDLYTIKKEIGRTANLCIAIVGDLKYGRTVHSLVYLLSKYKDICFRFVSPESLQLPDEIKTYLAENRIDFKEGGDLKDFTSEIDVLYQTRVQKERFTNAMDFERVRDKIILTRALVNRMKSNSIILHPLPRTNEIPLVIDTDHRAAYFKQAAYGLKIRKALLKYLFE